MAGDRLHDRAFIGRAHELEALRGGLAEALAGRGRLWLLAGEAGIGKTRLAEELAAEARRTGAAVLWGICSDSEGSPAFWPWVQVLRAAARELDAARVVAEMGAAGAAVAQLVPEVGATLPDRQLPPAPDPAQARFVLFDGVATFWRNASSHRPIVLVFDDLHWADAPSIRLLEFVARALRDQPMLIVGTFRDVELVPDDPLTRALDGLAREGQWLSLRGLAEDDLAHLVEAVAGRATPTQVTNAIHRLTEGNPFFAGEITRLLAAQGQLGLADPVFGVPPSVRETVRRRLGHLSSDCRRMLSAAAVIGREFEVGVLERVAGEADRDRLLVLLDEATRHQVIGAVVGEAGTYAFAHALVRESLYEELGVARAALHRRVGEVIEQLFAPVLESRLAELAHHFFAAAATGTADRAIAYATAAAQAAARLFAYEDAARQFELALRAVDLRAQGIGAEALSGAGLELQRAELLLGRADMLKRAGEIPGARTAALQAAAVARRAGAAEPLARAALSVPWQMMPARIQTDMVELLEEALGGLAPGDSALRAGLLARLAAELYLDHDPDRRLALSQQAVEMARRLDDPAALALALNGRRFALWGPDRAEERLAVADEVVRLAEQVDDRERALIGRLWRVADLLELGDIGAVDREIEACAASVEALRQPQLGWYVTLLRAMRALLDGRLGDGERLAGEAFNLGMAQNPSAALVYGLQIFFVRRAQGRLAEIEPGVMSFAQESLHLPGARCLIAFFAASLGRLPEAQAELDRLGARNFADVPRDGNWFNAVEQLVQVCVALRHQKHAEPLYALLAPYAARTLVVGAAAACHGSVAQYLGRLAALMRRWPDAVRHFEDALRANLLLGARPALAHTQQGYAEMLLERGAPGDHARAAELLTASCATYEGVGMPTYLGSGGELLARAGSAAAAAASRPTGSDEAAEALPAAPPAPANVFRRHGEYWEIDYAGTAIRLRDSRGIVLLGHLLRHPGREFHVADLARMTSTHDSPASSESYRDMSGALLAAENLAVDTGGPSPSIPDARAKAAYRSRLEGLREELEEAERFNNGERATRIRSELEFLATELSARYQLRGHASHTAPVERMRKAVSNRIRATLTKIQREHPVLWRHLHSSLKLGTFCSYQPDQPPDWVCG